MQFFFYFKIAIRTMLRTFGYVAVSKHIYSSFDRLGIQFFKSKWFKVSKKYSLIPAYHDDWIVCFNVPCKQYKAQYLSHCLWIGRCEFVHWFNHIHGPWLVSNLRKNEKKSWNIYSYLNIIYFIFLQKLCTYLFFCYFDFGVFDFCCMFVL